MFESTILIVLLSALFLSALERKYVSLSNARMSIFSSMYLGFIHSVTDFAKLLSKTFLEMNFISSFLWSMIMLKSFCLIYMLFFSMFFNISFFMNMNILIFILMYTMVIYLFISLNWTSSSIFSFLTLHRLMIQMISYESCMAFNFITLMMMLKSMSFIFNKSFMIMSYFFLMILIISFMSELSRQPFDFMECESELVSGFNIEYSGSLLSLIFLLEYFLQMMILIMLMSISMLSFIFITFFFLHLRTFFPRTRLDLMLNFFWKEMVIFISLYIFFSALM